MKRIVAAFAFVLLLNVSDALAQCVERRVSFARGQSSAVLKGSVTAAKSVCYKLRAKNGQWMTARLTSASKRARFTVMPDFFDAMPIEGADEVTEWEGALDSPAGDDFLISVYLPRGKGAEAYTLDVAIMANSSRAGNQTARNDDEQCGAFSGVYETNFGPLKLARAGDRVRGVYTWERKDDSSIEGTVAGNVLTGTWRQTDSRGKLRFTLGRDGRSFKGSFTTDGFAEGSGEWSGSCTGSARQ